jgi:3-oxoacyl-[acyl-carrier protein] reductase
MADGQVALVTGGTRRIGLAIARRLAREGYALALVYHEDEAAAAAALAELRPVARAITTLRLDVATPEGAARAVRETQRVLDSVDLLVNNVGPFIPGSLVETDLDAYELMVGGNLGAVFHLCREAIPLMRAQGSGHIINLGSLNAELARGAPNAALYHALKAGVVVLTRSIARSEGRYGIRANVVNPGMVDTLGVDEDIVNSIPLRRLGTGNDIANTVAWLAGNEAGYVSGAVINVHGGLWA